MARLPIPGSDEGTWGNVLNDYLGVAHNGDGTLKADAVADKADVSTTITAGTGLSGGGNLSADRTLSVNFGTAAGTVAQGNDSRITGALQSSVVDAKGDLLVAAGADAISRLAVGSDGEVLTADSAQPNGVKWGPAGGAGDPAVYPLAGYGLVAASDIPIAFGNTSTIGSGIVWLTRVWVPANTAFTKIALPIRTSGTYSASAVPNRLAWYDDSGVLQEATPDDSTMWSSSIWYTGTLPTPVPAQGTGRFIYLGFIVGGYAAVSPSWCVSVSDSLLSQTVGSSRRRTMFIGGQSALPSSFDPTSFGSVTGFTPLIGLVA